MLPLQDRQSGATGQACVNAMAILGSTRRVTAMVRGKHLWQATMGLWPAMLLALALLHLAAYGHAEAADGNTRLGVTTVTAQQQNSHEVTRHYAGEVHPGRTSTLGFPLAGTLQQLHVSEGDRVEQGSVLAALDQAPLEASREQAQARFELARASAEAARAHEALARASADRQQQLYERDQTSRQAFDEARLTLQAREAERMVAEAETAAVRAALRAIEVDLQQSRLRAPYTGWIQARHADLGAAVAAGEPVLRLVSDDQHEARIGLPAAIVEALQPDTPYRFRIAGEEVTGRLLQRLPEVSVGSRTVQVRFQLETERRLPVGALAELVLSREIPAEGYWLPISALTEAQRGLWSAFVVSDDDQRIERRLVDVIHVDGERAFVRGTLADGDQVVATGTRRIVPGQAVQIVEQAR